MQCGKKSLLAAILTVSLGATLVLVYFVAAFPSGPNKNEAGLGVDGNSADSSLRGNATATESESDSDSDEEGVFFVAEKKTPSPSTGPKFIEMNWEDLPQNIKNAAAALGFTEPSWDSGEPFADCDKKWEDLTRREKHAALTIGLNKHVWNQQVFYSTLYPTSITVFRFHYASFLWEDIPEDVQSAAEYLGYTETSWDDSEYLPLFGTSWEGLTDPQKSAAESLGFDQDAWNGSKR